MLQFAPNCSKRLQLALNGSKGLKMPRNDSKWLLNDRISEIANLTSWGQKIHPTSRTKKIMHPLKTKKNHATPQDKNKSRNLLGQKKIKQPLGTQKKS